MYERRDVVVARPSSEIGQHKKLGCLCLNLRSKHLRLHQLVRICRQALVSVVRYKLSNSLQLPKPSIFSGSDMSVRTLPAVHSGESRLPGLHVRGVRSASFSYHITGLTVIICDSGNVSAIRKASQGSCAPNIFSIGLHSKHQHASTSEYVV